MKQEPLEQRVLRFIREHLLVTQPQLVVAVSGGPDSVCLLHILHRLDKHKVDHRPVADYDEHGSDDALQCES